MIITNLTLMLDTPKAAALAGSALGGPAPRPWFFQSLSQFFNDQLNVDIKATFDMDAAGALDVNGFEGEGGTDDGDDGGYGSYGSYGSYSYYGSWYRSGDESPEDHSGNDIDTMTTSETAVSEPEECQNFFTRGTDYLGVRNTTTGGQRCQDCMELHQSSLSL